jgi:hypothetical protein
MQAIDPHRMRWLVTEAIPELKAEVGSIITVTREAVIVSKEHSVQAQEILRRNLSRLRLMPGPMRPLMPTPMETPMVPAYPPMPGEESEPAAQARVVRQKGHLSLLA